MENTWKIPHAYYFCFDSSHHVLGKHINSTPVSNNLLYGNPLHQFHRLQLQPLSNVRLHWADLDGSIILVIRSALEKRKAFKYTDFFFYAAECIER